jgi:hypothetical protein
LISDLQAAPVVAALAPAMKLTRKDVCFSANQVGMDGSSTVDSKSSTHERQAAFLYDNDRGRHNFHMNRIQHIESLITGFTAPSFELEPNEDYIEANCFENYTLSESEHDDFLDNDSKSSFLENESDFSADVNLDSKSKNERPGDYSSFLEMNEARHSEKDPSLGKFDSNDFHASLLGKKKFLRVGSQVEVRDTLDEPWGSGVVVGFGAGGWPIVRRAGWEENFEWAFYRIIANEGSSDMPRRKEEAALPVLSSIGNHPSAKGSLLDGKPFKSVSERLLNVLQQPGNNTCAECSNRQPRWASANIGVLLCIDCAGIHRGLGKLQPEVLFMFDSYLAVMYRGLARDPCVLCEIDRA